MSRFVRIANTSIGMKLLMAATGLYMFGFVIGHLAGNLKLFFGPEEFNSYAEYLRQHPSIAWPVRIGLLGSVLVHVVTGLRLWRRNRAARPRGSQGYRRETTLRASLASRFMVVSGLLLLGFIIYHLLHFTFLAVGSERSLMHDSVGRHDAYSMVYYAFQSPILTAAYVLAMSMLGMHLWHGAPSLPQTLGVTHSAYDRPLRAAARLVAVLLVLGFCSLPISIYFGFFPSAG